MTRDDITRMAREAGAMFDHMTWVERDLAPVFERFAALVEEATLEKNNLTWVANCQHLVKAEREACARVCDLAVRANSYQGSYQTVSDCAAVIRARGETK